MTFRRPAGILLGAALLVVPAAAQRGRAPAPTGLPADVLELACAPTLSFTEPPMRLRITGGQDSFVRGSYAPGDLVTISAGARDGITVGQEFYVRRPLVSRREPIGRDAPAAIRTTGWIQVYAVDERMSLATIAHACETIDVGDYLEPFVLPQVPAPAPERAAGQRENYGRVQIGQDRRRSFARGDYFMLNRGSDHGVTPGSRFVVYRDKGVRDNFLFEVGEAVAVIVAPDSSTLQVLVSLDAIHEGDLAAMQR